MVTAIIMLMIVSWLFYTGKWNCSIIDGNPSCFRAGTIFVQRHNKILLNIIQPNKNCKKIVAVPPFRSSVIYIGGITDTAYHQAFADIFSVAFGDRNRTISVGLFADEKRRAREKKLQELTPKHILDSVRKKLHAHEV